MNNLSKEDFDRMQLLDDRILVMEMVPTVTPSGIHLLSPEKWDLMAMVIKTGPGMKPEGMPVQPGQKIVMGQKGGLPMVFDLPDLEGGDGIKPVVFTLIKLNAVLGIVIEEPEQIGTGEDGIGK